jgi:calcineurin-like phosphoesterase family protein
MGSYLAAGFRSIHERTVLTLEGLGDVFLCHLPLRGDTPRDNGLALKYNDARPTNAELEAASPVAKILLHGHVHERWLRRDRMVNVGVDVWGFRPISEQALVSFILGSG